MTENPMIQSVEGRGEARASFPNTDMNSHLKLEAYIEMCLPKNFAIIDKHFDMLTLRRQGFWPLAYYANIQTTPQAIGFSQPVYLTHKTMLRRHVTERPKTETGISEKIERLFYDLQTKVTAHESQRPAESLGMGEPHEKIVHVGKIQMFQIFTKPMASPAERRVTQVPEALKRFQETPWEAPFPTVESLQEFPEDYQQANVVIPFYSVWGLSNTDPNQHVTMTEYIAGVQNHFTRMLFQAEKSVTAHFVHQAQFIFRKPFFPGQCYGIRGKLGFREEQTILLAGIYLADLQGKLAPQPSVFSRMEGSFCLQ